MHWWIRPLVRLLAAVVLPFAIPALITAALWLLPGDPAEIICPPQICTGGEELAKRWSLDQGPLHYYTTWIGDAASGSLGKSWRVQQGVNVMEMVSESLPYTIALVLLAMLWLSIGTVGASMGWLPKRIDGPLTIVGLLPAVIVALGCAAVVTINFGVAFDDPRPDFFKLLFGGLILAFTDGAMASAVVGTRSVFEAESKQRYVQVAILRGESAFSNMMPNVLPALVGQLRGRVLHVLSGTVVVEVVLQIPGLGGLLWRGTLLQDFGVVLAAAWVYALASAVLLFGQAATEVLVAMRVRSFPKSALEGVG